MDFNWMVDSKRLPERDIREPSFFTSLKSLNILLANLDLF
jgi:hypothetical protein